VTRQAQDESADKRRRGRPRDPAADAAILRAALELFIDGGVEGTSMQAVAQRAGVGKLTVYRRWSSKEELLAQAIETARGEIPEPPVDDIADTPVAELVERALPASAEVLAAPGFRAMVARIFGSAVSHPSLMATYWENYVLPRRRATRALLERAIQQGTLAAHVDPDVLTDMMVGAALYRVMQPEPLDIAEAQRYLQAVYREAGLLPNDPADQEPC